MNNELKWYYYWYWYTDENTLQKSILNDFGILIPMIFNPEDDSTYINNVGTIQIGQYLVTDGKEFEIMNEEKWMKKFNYIKIIRCELVRDREE